MSIRCVDGAVALLSDPQLASYAVDTLIQAVDAHWHTISDVLGCVEALAAMPDFPEREKASLLASKLYFHLDKVDNAITYAMAAGSHFDGNDNSDYTRTIMGAGVERYCNARQSEFTRIIGNFEVEEEEECSEALNRFVYSSTSSSRFERLFEEMVLGAAAAAQQDSEMDREICGVCVEARRFDLLKRILVESPNQRTLLRYCLRVAQVAVRSRWLEREIIQMAVRIYDAYLPRRTGDTWEEKDNSLEFLIQEALPLAMSLAILRDADRLADFLAYLIDRAGDEGELLALQIAFDVQSLENQQFSAEVLGGLRVLIKQEKTESESSESPQNEGSGHVPKDTDALATTALATDEEAKEEDDEVPFRSPWEKIRQILSGEATLDLNVWFLHKYNRADLVAMEKIKCAVDSRSSLSITAVALSQALLLAGTTSDAFVRNNLDWLARSSCWTKFVVAGSTGVLHRGHLSAARTVLAAYLPQVGSSTSTGGPYSEGGGLFALGLILANCFRQSECDYFCEMIRTAEQHCSANFEPIQVGACLGLGLLAMGSCREDIAAALRHVLFVDAAVSGEAAALALGMTHMGSLDGTLALQLLEHARETEHERVRRGAALGVALLAFQKEEQADAVIESLCTDKHDALRLAGQWALGLAFCGTGHATAIRRLLQRGVGDLCPDVRRAAVLALSFVLTKRPADLSRILSLLSDSYDPHVRYGAALALGLAGEAARTGSFGVVATLLRLAEDATDFVRQAAFIGLGMSLCQLHPRAVSEVREAREMFTAAITRKHEDSLARFGAIVGSGLIDAGGKNGGFSLCSASGAVRPESAVGLLMFFLQWHWHPYILGISLAMRPQALLGLDQDLQVPPDFVLGCRAATAERTVYYEAPAAAVRETRVSAVAAVLTQKRRRKRKVDDKVLATPTAEPAEDEKKTETDKTVVVGQDGWARLPNPARVLSIQKAHLNLNMPDSAWQPLDSDRRTGFVLLRPKPAVQPPSPVSGDE